jgi:hypothetical protein
VAGITLLRVSSNRPYLEGDAVGSDVPAADKRPHILNSMSTKLMGNLAG